MPVGREFYLTFIPYSIYFGIQTSPHPIGTPAVMDSHRYTRPRADDNDVYQWHIGRVPEKATTLDGKEVDNPALKSAIFLVHGMGDQQWGETTAQMRVGFEVALEEIDDQTDVPLKPPEETPPPYIAEGYWGDYDNLKKSFPDDWALLDKVKRKFFTYLWERRSISAVRTLLFFFKQQIRLIHPRVITEIHLFAWLLYLPLQVVLPPLFLVLFLFSPRIISRILGDVRLYIAPHGVVERAIVQRVDKRTGAAFLRLIGLDWDFKKIPDSAKVLRNGKPVTFDRIIWVAHSLGTVVSYNVLSDLFHLAEVLEKDGTPEQKAGVARFRDSLRRFITLGSPLDKIAFLFGEDALRPWPETPRINLVTSRKASPKAQTNSAPLRDFWVNFYHVLDPVSGALSNPLICGEDAPMNFHTRFFRIPGLAHISYWHDKKTLTYILSRVYGPGFLPLKPMKEHPALALTLFALIGYIVWASVILLLLLLIIGVVSRFIGWASGASLLNLLESVWRFLVPFV